MWFSPLDLSHVLFRETQGATANTVIMKSALVQVVEGRRVFLLHTDTEGFFANIAGKTDHE